MKVSDVIEVLNHIHCVNYIIDHVMEPLTQKFIRKLHKILMTGTIDAYCDQVRPGGYQTIKSRPRNRHLPPAGQIHSRLGELIISYEHQTEIERNHILDFHVRFEEMFPFEDGYDRIGRLILLKIAGPMTLCPSSLTISAKPGSCVDSKNDTRITMSYWT